MTERFTMFGSTIKDNGEEITAWDCCSLLNEQHETIQSIKNILNELNNIEEFWDSALLQKYIDKIANELEVDLE